MMFVSSLSLSLLLAASSVSAANFDIQVTSTSFTPSSLQIHLGDTVTWHFATGSSVTESDGTTANLCIPLAKGITSGVKAAGSTYSFTFSKAVGTFPFFSTVSTQCSKGGLHGVVTILPAGVAPSASNSAASATTTTTTSASAALPSSLPGVNGTATNSSLLPDILSVAKKANLTQLLSVVNQTDLTNVLEGLTNVTIFAPIDAAFLNASSMATQFGVNLTASVLSSILELHVVPGILTQTQLLAKNGQNLTSLGANGTAVFTIVDTNKTIGFQGSGNLNGPVTLLANQSLTGIPVKQGVVYLINGVILPNLLADVTKNTTSSSASATGTGASATASPTKTSGGIMMMTSSLILMMGFSSLLTIML